MTAGRSSPGRRAAGWADQAIVHDARHQLHNSFYTDPVRITPLRMFRLLITPEFQAVAWYRLAHALWYRRLRPVAFFAYLRAKRLGCDIAPQASIGPGLRIVHAMDIVIGAQARLGRDVVLFNGVTVGNRLGGHGESGMPTIGDRVLLGSGAKVMGPIEIGDDARIGAASVVLVSVPARATAVGNPARIVLSGDNHS